MHGKGQGVGRPDRRAFANMTNEHHFWVFGDEPRKFSGARYDRYGEAGHFIGAEPAQVFLLHRAGQQVAHYVGSCGAAICPELDEKRKCPSARLSRRSIT